MTREEAILKVGPEMVEAVEAGRYKPTGRIDYNGDEPCYDGPCYDMEWAASVYINNDTTLKAYFYTSGDDYQAVYDAGGDWGVIDWKPARYELV